MTSFQVDTKIVPEKAIIVGIDRGDIHFNMEESLCELTRLVNTAGAEVVSQLTQKLLKPNPRTFIGSGKVEELVHAINAFNADLVVIDDELSPSQQSNLETSVPRDVKVIDRTALILDIFALHAKTHEGVLQVRLAQNQYLYPRLRGMWSHLASNRMGGGVGSRFGEGESQLEVDRRLVRNRITSIRKELKIIEAQRLNRRKSRNNSGVFRIALAGYTNAGKSSLLNALTNSNVYTYDKLFATLDSTTRQLVIDQKIKAVISDTVGFIQKLPHNLVEAFHSTLDEISEANLILLVADASSNNVKMQIQSVYDVFDEIGVSHIPIHIVFNKSDLIENPNHMQEIHPDASICSAKTKFGIDNLLNYIKNCILSEMTLITVKIPFAKGKLVQIAHNKGYIYSEKFTENGTKINMRLPNHLVSLFESYKTLNYKL